MKIALLTTRLFEVPHSGGEICTSRLMQTLRDAGHEVVCVGRGSNANDFNKTLSLDPAAVVSFDELSAIRKALVLVGAIARGQASTVQRLNAGGVALRARQALAALSAGPADPPDVLVVDHLQTYAWVADAGADIPPVVLVMHNLEAQGYAERARRLPERGVASKFRRGMLKREATHLLALETLALRRAAAIACLSEDDAEYFRHRVAACGSDAPVVVLPGYPLCPPLTTVHVGPTGTGRRVGMIGTWTWGPNRDALRWMLERVVPLWHDCTLVLAGGGLDGLLLPERVVSLGRIDEVSSFYDAVDVLAVPSLHGSGVQEKAIEAIGSGRTVVATRHAMRGLAPGLPRQVHEADEPGPFARLCVESLTAPSVARRDDVLQWSGRRRAAYGAAVDRCIAAAVYGLSRDRAAVQAT